MVQNVTFEDVGHRLDCTLAISGVIVAYPMEVYDYEHILHLTITHTWT